jgi:DNA-binding CsgD family transcriptional regulator
MALLSADQRELYLPMMEGLTEDPPWTQFLRNLVARTQARRASLSVRISGQPPFVLQAAAPRAVQDQPLDLPRLGELGLDPYGLMRPGRVYALDELFDYDNPARQAAQRSVLSEMRINHARAVRVGTPGESEAWLLIVREREDLSAADSALLSALAPHLAAALRVLVALDTARLSAAMAQAGLAQLGIGELAFSAAAHVLAADPVAERLLAFSTAAASRRLQLLPDATRALEAACAALSGAPSEARRLVQLRERQQLDLLLRPADLALAGPGIRPTVIGLVRKPQRKVSVQALQIVSAAYGLSANEAALAIGIMQGEAILEAGTRLGLTPETARNYSKRIYAKTGTRGQADLVRLLLSGLAPFC